MIKLKKGSSNLEMFFWAAGWRWSYLYEFPLLCFPKYAKYMAKMNLLSALNGAVKAINEVQLWLTFFGGYRTDWILCFFADILSLGPAAPSVWGTLGRAGGVERSFWPSCAPSDRTWWISHWFGQEATRRTWKRLFSWLKGSSIFPVCWSPKVRPLRVHMIYSNRMFTSPKCVVFSIQSYIVYNVYSHKEEKRQGYCYFNLLQ